MKGGGRKGERDVWEVDYIIQKLRCDSISKDQRNFLRSQATTHHEIKQGFMDVLGRCQSVVTVASRRDQLGNDRKERNRDTRETGHGKV